MGELKYRITPGRALRYREAVEDHNPWHEGASPFGGPIAPPTICDLDLLFLPGVQEKVVRGKNGEFRTMLFQAAIAYEFLNPAILGKRITVTGRIVDKYEKRGRVYVVGEALSVDEDGRQIFRHKTTWCWLPVNLGQ